MRPPRSGSKTGALGRQGTRFFLTPLSDVMYNVNIECYVLWVLGGIDMATQIFTAVLHREGELYVAECPEIGTVSQGYTVEEAVDNLKEATELYLEEFPLPSVSRPLLTTFEATVYAQVA